MCGVAGFFGRGTRDDLAAMTRAQAHRGPDGEGIYVDTERPLYLGHLRLTIRDATGGVQPLWNEDETVCVIFNGEIYNHNELRETLIERGHVFKSSHSDTEVLVHGYEEWGRNLPSKLNGMFAFTVYDSRQRKLFLARDRFGEKPLFYSAQPGLFAFASELSALTSHSGVSAEFSSTALRKYFAWGYIPQPYTLYDTCRKLPSGHFLEFDLETEASCLQCYWRFRLTPDEAMSHRPLGDMVEELRTLLSQAVSRRLVSDVPLGMFLSGGLDSSLILALLTRLREPASVKAFTIGFTDPSFDESEPARAVAKHLGVDHHLRVLDLDRAKNLIPDVLGRLDEPLGDPSIIPTYLLSAFSRETVTVTLSGDGGDELFAGYDPFDALAPASAYQRFVPAPLHRVLRAVAERLPRSTSNMSFDFKLRRALMGLSYPDEVRAAVWMAPLEPKQQAALFGTERSLDELYGEAASLWENCATDNDIDRLLEFFTVFYLQDDILVKTDRAAMMNSLESRAVFLDNDLVDFCEKLPHDLKYRNGQRKFLLRKCAETLLPDEIINRPKKGFGIPLAAWLMTVPQRPPLKPVAGLSSDWMRAMWAEHRAGKADHRLLLWSWLSLQYVAERRLSSTLAA